MIAGFQRSYKQLVGRNTDRLKVSSISAVFDRLNNGQDINRSHPEVKCLTVIDEKQFFRNSFDKASQRNNP